MSFDPVTARKIANWFNEQGRKSSDRGTVGLARVCYQFASFFDSTWSVPYYNRGLLEKYEGNWESSLWLNQRALELDADDEAAWWNLGIAATALADWAEARRAWKGCGIEVPEGAGEIRISLPRACLRLDPDDKGEVVWGQRLDPARIEIQNVPLPASQHRFRDIVLHDGAPNGTRVVNQEEFPVFDELMLWKASDYSTFQVNLQLPSEAALDGLMDICDQRELGIEDWSTVRMLCSKCSHGNPGPHECRNSDEEQGESAFGFAARSEGELASALRQWTGQSPDAGFGDIQLLLSAEAET